MSQTFNRVLWDGLADAWDRQRAWHEKSVASVTSWLLDAIAIAPSHTVLDLAAGNGEAGLIAAKRAHEGHVIIADISPKMIATAERRGAELGVSNVEYRVLDAEAMDLSNASIDGIVCRWGYMLMSDRERAFKETHRVLRKGGRVAFSVWAEAKDNPYFVVPSSVLIERGLFKPDPAAPNMFFTLSTTEALTAAVTKGGFPPPCIERIELEYRFEVAADFWTFMTQVAGPFAKAMSTLDEDARNALRDATFERCRPFRVGEGFVFPAVTLVAVATKE